MIDVIVAGAGPAGSVAALVLARAGARVCLLERDLAGGAHWLAGAAVAAGARLERGVRVDGPIWREVDGRTTVAGVQMCRRGTTMRVPALITIGADGRDSALARYATGVPGLLLAGDAAGCVEPIIGDGTHLAIRSGMRAAAAALEALETV